MEKMTKIITLTVVIGILLVSCSNSRKQFEGTWTGYRDGDYVELAITGSTWRITSSWVLLNSSGNSTFDGNKITLQKSSGNWIGIVAGNGMSMNDGQYRFTLFKK